MVIRTDYHSGITTSELKRLLKRKGCTFSEGTRHTIVDIPRRVDHSTRHPSQEVATGTVKAILKKLGVK